jgi:hypothetical protein
VIFAKKKRLIISTKEPLYGRQDEEFHKLVNKFLEGRGNLVSTIPIEVWEVEE